MATPDKSIKDTKDEVLDAFADPQQGQVGIPPAPVGKGRTARANVGGIDVVRDFAVAKDLFEKGQGRAAQRLLDKIEQRGFLAEKVGEIKGEGGTIDSDLFADIQLMKRLIAGGQDSIKNALTGATFRFKVPKDKLRLLGLAK